MKSCQRCGLRRGEVDKVSGLCPICIGVEEKLAQPNPTKYTCSECGDEKSLVNQKGVCGVCVLQSRPGWAGSVINEELLAEMRKADVERKLKIALNALTEIQQMPGDWPISNAYDMARHAIKLIEAPSKEEQSIIKGDPDA